jgi:hypothetical protein
VAGMTLRQTVDHFANLTHSLPDPELETEWTWGEYEEGVRFAFFRIYEELRTLAAELQNWRAASNQPQTTAQHILAQYHAAYRDLQVILLGVDETVVQQSPVDDEWPLWRVLLHIIGADAGFFAVILDAIERERKQDGRPMKMTDEAWEAFWGSEPFEGIIDRQSYTELLDYYENLHQRIIHEFQDISDPELNIPVVYWEKEPMTLQFRLHRFDSHLRQHTVQAEKTSVAIGFHPNESQRLLRLIYVALAEVEGVLIGGTHTVSDIQAATVARIASYTDEIAPLIT